MSKKLTDKQLAGLARKYGFPEDVVRAVVEVESRGSGFDSQGRVTILFEPHIFYREINDPRIRDTAVQKGLAYRTWGTLKYPKDSYPRFSQAFALDPVAAMKSCSWGMGQVMGFNHVAAGFDEVGLMVDAFKESEANQIEGMLAFIKEEGLDDELMAKNWSAFARGYNGPGYAKNGYHTKLKKAFDKWVKVPDIQLDEEKKCAV